MSPAGAALARAARASLAGASGAEDAFAEQRLLVRIVADDRGVREAGLRQDAGVALRVGPLHQPRWSSAPITPDPEGPAASPEQDDAGRLALAAVAAARESEPAVIRAEARLEWTCRRFAVVRRDGLVAAEEQGWLWLELQVLAEHGVRRCGGSANGVRRTPPASTPRAWARQIGRRAARLARRGFDAVAPAEGPLPVVLQGSAAGVLLHEVIGHGLEADLLARDASPFAGRAGQRVAPRSVTVVDDGAVPGLGGTLGVDDEGVRPRPTTLIEGGVLCGALCDRAWAAHGAGPPGGNGRRASYRDPPLPRMTNTYLAAGDAEPDAVIAALGSGLLCRGMHAGTWDASGGEVRFTVGDATWIEGGVLDAPATPLALVGRGEDLLRGLEAVGRDLRFCDEYHTCTKQGQVLPVGVGSPTLLVRGLRAALR